MDVGAMARTHVETEAEVTIASIPMPREEGSRFGVLETAEGGRILGFHEKVAEPPTIPGDPERCLVSMGNYIFTRSILEEVLETDAALPDSSRDFGKDILPRMVAEGRAAFAYDFETNRVPGMEAEKNTYWRDIGTLEAYYEAALDLKEPVPQLDLRNRDWPVHTAALTVPPTRVVREDAYVYHSILGPGCVLNGAELRNCVLGAAVRVERGAKIDSTILMEGVTIEQGSHVRRAILDKGVHIEPGTHVGYDADADRERGWHVTPTGITVIPKQHTSRPVTTLDL
jgi:glucose-1-phosphate adenylyltransferase